MITTSTLRSSLPIVIKMHNNPNNKNSSSISNKYGIYIKGPLLSKKKINFQIKMKITALSPHSSDK